MKKIFLTSLCAIAIALSGCNKEQEDLVPEVPRETTKLKNPINNFVWKAMNSWYNWQSEVNNLADTKSKDKNAYNKYLNEYSSPSKLFESLLYKKGEIDLYSWFIEDYVKQQQQFQGITESFGMRISLVKVDETNKVVMYISYVSPKSPADLAGIKRGDLVNAINDQVITTENYRTVLKGYSQNNTVKLTFVEKDGKKAIESKTITRAIVKDNPVYMTKTFNINGKKVGYLVYNSFRSSYNDELNTAFKTLKEKGIQELILDLRLNRGGSVSTCTYLASMICKEANTDVFAELKFNSKHSRENGKYFFTDKLHVYNEKGERTGTENINRLSGLSKIYVLASNNTASASEMIINGLRPFIKVDIIGTKTAGKNVGSITLYDSPESQYTSQKGANKSHKNAMQPIVFQIYNKLGESDYIKGFEPDTKVEEWKHWRNILPFGDENETLLKVALNKIKGVSARKQSSYLSNNSELIDYDIDNNKFSKEMYIESDFFTRK